MEKIHETTGKEVHRVIVGMSSPPSLSLFSQLAVKEVPAVRSLRKIIAMSNHTSTLDAKVNTPPSLLFNCYPLTL